MKARGYLRNAVLLTASGFALRVLGMGFRVVMAGYLGSEGMGLYQLIYAVYMVFVSFATAGIGVAAARLAAQSMARGYGVAETVRSLCGTALCFGCVSMVAQTLLAGPAAMLLLHDGRAEMPLRILAFSLPFMAVEAALRGCFLAARRVQPGIAAQMSEQLLRMAAAVVGLRAVSAWGVGYGCAAVMLGSVAGEIASCAIMAVAALRTPAFVRCNTVSHPPYTRRELYGIVLPVEGNRMLASGLQAVESSLIPNMLTLYCGTRADAMAQYGSLKGMALPMLFFPFSVLTALSGLLMPEIARASSRKDRTALRKLIYTMLKITGAFSLAVGMGFLLFGRQTAGILYADEQVGHYLQVLGLAAPFMYLESMVDGVLKGLGEQMATFRYALLDSAFRITAICILLPRYGIAAFLGIMIASNLLTFMLNTVRMFKVIG